MYQLISYIKFLFKSKNQHGVHSPFVFDLVTNCFYDKTDYSDYSKLKAYRDSLLENTESIAVTDFGIGSKVFSSNKRGIKHMAKTSGTTPKRAQLLYRLVSYLEPKTSLELGTSLGIGTYAMALSKPDATVISIEGCPEISQFTRQQLEAFQIKNTTIKTGAFTDVLPNLNQQNWDLVFFDGHHDKEATLNYFNQLLPTAHNDSVFIFDDIHWSKGMSDAWDGIKKHPKVTVTIDTFFWGLVFFRQEQVKEDFVIRL